MRTENEKQQEKSSQKWSEQTSAKVALVEDGFFNLINEVGGLPGVVVVGLLESMKFKILVNSVDASTLQIGDDNE